MPSKTLTLKVVDCEILGCYKWYQRQTSSGVPVKTFTPKGVDCEIPHRLKRGTKHSLQGCVNLNRELDGTCNGLNQTISANGGLEINMH